MFSTCPIADPMTAPVTIDGIARAWRMDLDAIRKFRHISADNDGTLDMWLIEAPWANLAWHSYVIILIHLRPLPDNRSTKFYLDGASHEIWVYALNPDADRNEMLRTGQIRFLTPINFASQFIESDDDAARQRVEKAVRMICEGKLSPDTDYIRHWMYLFGDNMIKDKLHAGETRIITDKGEIVIPPQPGPQDKH